MTAFDDRTARWIAARRRVAWQHHPDRGGDPQVFTQELARVEAEFGRRRTGRVAQRLAARRPMPRHRLRATGKRLRRVMAWRVFRPRRYIEL